MKPVQVTRAALVLVMACGGSGQQPDASADGVDSRVHLTVTVAGEPASKLDVYYQNADSSLVAHLVTDVHGEVVSELAAGGFVTVIEPRAPGAADRLDTFTDVQPSDQLRLDLLPPPPHGTISFEISVPPAATASSYHLWTSCGDQAVIGTTNTAILTGCNGIADLLVTALDMNDMVFASLYTPSVAVTANHPVMLSDTYGPNLTESISYTGVPNSAANIQVAQSLVGPHGPLYLAVDAVPASSSTSLTLTEPAAAGVLVVTRTDLYPITSAASQASIMEWSPRSASYAIDLAPVLLGEYTTLPRLEPATHAIVWTESSGATPNVVWGQYHTVRGGQQWLWSIAAARATAPALRFPTLPTDLFDYNAGPSDQVSVYVLTNASIPGGFAAIRTAPFRLLDPTALAPTGRMVSTSLFTASTRR
ncbi:MAG: hypothetical protein JWO36_566 [Myxococcales bacterium]|nr:hypothetical protein [Myxococcales bacterium]